MHAVSIYILITFTRLKDTMHEVHIYRKNEQYACTGIIMNTIHLSHFHILFNAIYYLILGYVSLSSMHATREFFSKPREE